MDNSFNNELLLACYRVSPSNDKAKAVYYAIRGSEKYWSLKEMFENVQTRKDAAEKIIEMVKEITTKKEVYHGTCTTWN